MPSDTKPKAETPGQRVKRYAREEKSWRDSLRPYWTQMQKNEELYEFYKSEYTETQSNVALNTPFAIIESQVARENTAAMHVTVQGEGSNDLSEFEKWVAASVKQAMEDRRVARIKGPFRKKRERFSRSLKVVGNAVAEIAYCYQKQVSGGREETVADNPYLINRTYKDISFNPSRQFDSSNVYYVTDYLRIEDMEKSAYDPQRNSGKFRNLGEVRKALAQNSEGTPQSDDDEVRYSAGDRKVSRKNEAVKVVTRWELKPAGWTRMAYAMDRVEVMPDEVDPLRLGCHNLLLAMRYVVEGRPYAYGEMDPIYKPVRAQDTIVNQKIEIINKYLRGSYIAGPSIDVDSLMMVLDQGGVMSGVPDDIKSVPVNLPPQAAFQETAELQQAIERAARYSGYGNGVAQSDTDRTKGTKGGILALQGAAEPNVEAQIDDIEDMLLEPYAYSVLRMKAAYMSPDETFNALIEGKSPQWIKATKGILSGKATIQDFVTAGIIDAKEVQGMQGQVMPDGKPVTASTVLFDVSWLISVKLSAEGAQERADRASREQGLIEFAVEKLGAQFDPDRVVEYLADKQDASEITGLLLTPEEKQERAQAQQQSQQAQLQAQTQSEMAIKEAGKSTPAPEKTTERVNVQVTYKDAPPDVQREMEALAGLNPSVLHPQAAQTLKQPLPVPPEPVAQGSPSGGV